MGIEVVAASTDNIEDARRMVDKWGLGFPLGFGLNLKETAARFGAFFETRRGILHATGFLIRPDGTIAVATYSSGAIGRMTCEEVMRLVEFWERRKP